MIFYHLKKMISLLLIFSLLVPRDLHGEDFPFSEGEKSFINTVSILKVISTSLFVSGWIDKRFALNDKIYSKEFGKIPFFSLSRLLKDYKKYRKTTQDQTIDSQRKDELKNLLYQDMKGLIISNILKVFFIPLMDFLISIGFFFVSGFLNAIFSEVSHINLEKINREQEETVIKNFFLGIEKNSRFIPSFNNYIFNASMMFLTFSFFFYRTTSLFLYSSFMTYIFKNPDWIGKNLQYALEKEYYSEYFDLLYLLTGKDLPSATLSVLNTRLNSFSESTDEKSKEFASIALKTLHKKGFSLDGFELNAISLGLKFKDFFPNPSFSKETVKNILNEDPNLLRLFQDKIYFKNIKYLLKNSSWDRQEDKKEILRNFSKKILYSFNWLPKRAVSLIHLTKKEGCDFKGFEKKLINHQFLLKDFFSTSLNSWSQEELQKIILFMEKNLSWDNIKRKNLKFLIECGADPQLIFYKFIRAERRNLRKVFKNYQLTQETFSESLRFSLEKIKKHSDSFESCFENITFILRKSPDKKIPLEILEDVFNLPPGDPKTKLLTLFREHNGDFQYFTKEIENENSLLNSIAQDEKQDTKEEEPDEKFESLIRSPDVSQNLDSLRALLQADSNPDPNRIFYKDRDAFYYQLRRTNGRDLSSILFTLKFLKTLTEGKRYFILRPIHVKILAQIWEKYTKKEREESDSRENFWFQLEEAFTSISGMTTKASSRKLLGFPLDTWSDLNIAFFLENVGFHISYKGGKLLERNPSEVLSLSQKKLTRYPALAHRIQQKGGASVTLSKVLQKQTIPSLRARCWEVLALKEDWETLDEDLIKIKETTEKEKEMRGAPEGVIIPTIDMLIPPDIIPYKYWELYQERYTDYNSSFFLN